MGEVIKLVTPPQALSLDEMRVEWRATQDEMIEIAAEQLLIAEALWPEGDSERPDDLHDAGVTGARLVAGVVSLHEYCGRLLAENEALRARLADHG